MATRKPTSRTTSRRTRRPGRPPAIDGPTQQRLCDLLAMGTPDEAACQEAGVAVRTFYRWLAAGEEAALVHEVAEQEEQPLPNETALLAAQRDFWDAVQRARGQRKVVYLRRIAAAAAGGEKTVEVRREIEHVQVPQPDGTTRVEARIVKETRIEREQLPVWQAAAWILERRHPEEFGRRERVELTQPDAPEHRINVGRMALEDPLVAAAVDKLLDEAVGHHSSLSPGKNPEPGV